MRDASSGDKIIRITQEMISKMNERRKWKNVNTEESKTKKYQKSIAKHSIAKQSKANKRKQAERAKQSKQADVHHIPFSLWLSEITKWRSLSGSK